MKMKLIAMDIDGTLVDSKKKITMRTREVLKQAQEQGIILILASGRPTNGLLQFARELEMDRHHGLLVSYNGARVTDCETGEILFDQAIPTEQAKAVLEHLKQFPQVRPIIDRGEYMYVNDVYHNMITYQGRQINIIQSESRSNGYKLCEVDDLAAFADYPINKILTAADPEYLQEHYKEMAAPFAETLSCMFTAPYYYEFTAEGIDKAKALDTVFKKLGYQAETMIAFGDGHNDISMLRYAGIGVAMANAVQELKEAADEITGSNEEDGIAESLEKYLKNIKIH